MTPRNEKTRHADATVRGEGRHGSRPANQIIADRTMAGRGPAGLAKCLPAGCEIPARWGGGSLEGYYPERSGAQVRLLYELRRTIRRSRSECGFDCLRHTRTCRRIRG